MGAEEIVVLLRVDEGGFHLAAGGQHFVVGVPFKLFGAQTCALLTIYKKGKRDHGNVVFLQKIMPQIACGICDDNE